MRTIFSPSRILGAGAALLAAAALIAWIAPSSDYLLLPDQAHPTAPLVAVQGEKPPHPGGGIYFVDVIERKATLLEQIFPGIRSGSTLVPASALIAPGGNDQQRQQESLAEMSRSQKIASAVALRAAGYRVKVTPRGALVTAVAVDVPAAGKLRPSDVIVAVDGQPVRTPADLRRLIGLRRPGVSVALRVKRSASLQTLVVRTVADPANPGRPIVGIVVDQQADITLPLKVKINAGSVGGPSAGLAFALEIYEKLGREVDRGYLVAATGELDLDGTVSAIGGVKQKVIGARRTGVDVFLVPAGDNYREAVRNAGRTRVIAVTSFQQALQALATLPPKRI